jgi:hypothetical protein
VGQWLLDLSVGGVVYRYSTSAADVRTASGRVLSYLAGLADFELRLDGLEESQGLEVLDLRQSWALLAARGDGLDRQSAVLRYWESGDEIERARLVIDGVVDTPEYGEPNSPGRLVFTLQVPDLDQLFPDAQAVVDTTTFVNTTNVEVIDDQVVGAVYPYVFGYPGHREGSDDPDIFPAVPALLVKYNAVTGAGESRLLIGAGTMDVAHRSALVTLWDSDETDGAILDFANQTETAQLGQDLLGRTYSFIEFTIAAPIAPVVGHHYYTSYTPSAGGGLLLPDRSGPIRSLTDVAIWVLRNSGRQVDLQAQETQRDQLDRFSVDGYLNQRLALLPWFEQQLQPLFPIVRVRGPKGIYYRHVDWSATRTSARAQLSADTGEVRRASSLTTVRDALANQFTLEYAQSPQTGGYYGRRVLAPQSGLSAVPSSDPSLLYAPVLDERIIGAPLCARSEAKYGPIERDVVQTPFLWSDLTAVQVLQYWSALDCFPRRFVDYTGANLAGFVRGDIVTITDAEVGLDRAVALVDAVTLSGQRLVTLSLEILDLTFRSTV